MYPQVHQAFITNPVEAIKNGIKFLKAKRIPDFARLYAEGKAFNPAYMSAFDMFVEQILGIKVWFMDGTVTAPQYELSLVAPENNMDTDVRMAEQERGEIYEFIEVCHFEFNL